MATSRQLASGRHLTGVVLTLQTVAIDGTLSGSTAYTLVDKTTYVGYLEDVEFDLEQNIEDGTVLGSPYDNDIPSTNRFTATLTEPLRYQTSGNNLLAAAYMNAVANADGTAGTPYVTLACTRGGKAFTLYGLMRSYREMYRKNKLVGVMTLSVMDNAVGTSIAYA